MRKFKTIEELHNKFNWNSPSKFVPIAKKYGFTELEARDFLRKKVIHDIKVPKAKFMPIVSKELNGYQMDTFINDKKKDGLNYLILININTRKAYSYPLKGKGSKTILEALEKFFDEVDDVYSITSDQDKAYLSNDVLEFMKNHNVVYRTTEDNNHNVLGIINRLMRTLRDLVGENRYIDEDEMSELIDTYNSSPHKSLKYKAPNDFTEEDEKRYIKEKSQINPYDFKANEKVRLVFEKSPFSKKRKNVSKVNYIIDSKSGNQFLIKSKDESVDKMPGYRLIKDKNERIPLAETIKGGKRGEIEKIVSYDVKKNKYHIIWTDGSTDFIPSSNLREGNPTKLSLMEIEYWSKQKTIPEKIKKWI